MSAQQDASPLNNHDWADAAGQRWLDHLDQFESMLAPIGAKAIAAARLQPGERVVDVGCGGGATTLDIAQRLGPAGLAVGADVAPMLVEAAKKRLADAGPRPGAAPVRFVCGDASTMALADAPFDVLFSRFGVMFFKDPAAAFTHMRGWLKPTGRLAFQCWAPPQDNPWILEVNTIMSRYVPAPAPDPNAPGPFGLSNVDRVRKVLTKAGFKDIAIDSWRGGQAIGGPGATVAQAVDFAEAGMSVGQLLAEAPKDARPKARAEVTALFAKHHTKEGVMMPSAAWIVTAKA